jgi:hypothetical protein
LALCCWLSANGQQILRPGRKNLSPINFEADIQFTYDDNIFLYSVKDLKDFQRSIRPYRYPFETYDDFITTLTGILRIRQKLVGQMPTILSLRYRQHQYAVNRMKSYQLFSLNLEQNFAKPIAVEFGYLFLPKYLIRYYKDPRSQTSPPIYIGCEFEEHLLSLGLIYNTQNKLNFTPFYKFEIDDYNHSFDYYDTKAHRVGLDGSYRFGPKINLKGEFEYKVARAEGPIPDISYNQWAWQISVELKPRFHRLSLTADYGQEQRVFVTSNLSSVDPFHAGRLDKTQNFKFGLEIPFSRVISILFDYEFEKREVSSPYKEEIDDVKDYKNNKVGLGLNVRRFW